MARSPGRTSRGSHMKSSCDPSRRIFRSVITGAGRPSTTRLYSVPTRSSVCPSCGSASGLARLYSRTHSVVRLPELRLGIRPRSLVLTYSLARPSARAAARHPASLACTHVLTRSSVCPSCGSASGLARLYSRTHSLVRLPELRLGIRPRSLVASTTREGALPGGRGGTVLVPGQHSLQRGLPRPDQLPRVPESHRGGRVREGLGAGARPQPARLHLRLGLRRALRDGLPPQGGRQAPLDPLREEVPLRLDARERPERRPALYPAAAPGLRDAGEARRDRRCGLRRPRRGEG